MKEGIGDEVKRREEGRRGEKREERGERQTSEGGRKQRGEIGREREIGKRMMPSCKLVLH